MPDGSIDLKAVFETAHAGLAAVLHEAAGDYAFWRTGSRDGDSFDGAIRAMKRHANMIMRGDDTLSHDQAMMMAVADMNTADPCERETLRTMFADPELFGEYLAKLPRPSL